MANLLIVEDSQVTAHMVTRSLQSAGHKCRWAATGGQALEEIRDHPADLTILDYVLPDLNGMEVLKGILDLNPAALVVMVTGQGDETLAASVIKAGARDYVAKTGRFYEPLVHVVEQVLREEATRCALEEKARLTGRLQAQNAISFWMAHNFKNLFTGAIGFLDLIDPCNPDQPPERRAYFQQQVRFGLSRALALVDQLLALTDVKPGPPEDSAVSALVDEAFQAALAKAAASGRARQEITLDNLTSDLPVVPLRVSDARLVLENVLQNAIEASDGGGSITVQARLNERALILTITDHGRGMDTETLRKAIEPLFSTKGTVGVGMGLSLAQGVLLRQNGDLRLESAPGQGTTVTVHLPLPDVGCMII